MEIVQQIKQICLETDNEWFLTFDFTQIALCDLKLKSKLEKENIFTFNEMQCICHTKTGENCIRCYSEMERHEEIAKLNLRKYSNIYDYDKHYYAKSIWIIPDHIENEIPGFILIKCKNVIDGYTHFLEFACVRHKHRKKGILKNMINRIPNEWNIALEANSNEIVNVENIWEKCGFKYHTTIQGHLIYVKSAF